MTSSSSGSHDGALLLGSSERVGDETGRDDGDQHGDE